MNQKELERENTKLKEQIAGLEKRIAELTEQKKQDSRARVACRPKRP